MTGNPLFMLRDWLKIEEAAQLLSQMIDFGEPVDAADILRLGLDGHVSLSVYLPQGTTAMCWNLDENTPPDDDHAVDDPTCFGIIDGVWDLPMVPPGSLEIENQFNELRGLPRVPLEGLTGAVVERPGIHCRLCAKAEKDSLPSALPAGTSVLVRTPSIIQFASTLLKPDPLTKSLSDSERTTLLLIIATVAAKGNVDISEPYAAGKLLVPFTPKGVTLSEKTIGNYLNVIKPAIKARTK